MVIGGKFSKWSAGGVCVVHGHPFFPAGAAGSSANQPSTGGVRGEGSDKVKEALLIVGGVETTR